MQAGNTSTSNSNNKVEEINLDDQLNFILRNLQTILDGQKLKCTFEELYRFVYTMCLHRNGALVYNGVRELVKQHIDKMATKLQDMANDREWENRLALHVDQFWSNFTSQIHSIRELCMYLERVFVIHSADRELFSVYGWRLFRTEILGNQLITSALAHRLVLNPAEENADEIAIASYSESPLFNEDTIIEIFNFLTTLKLGLQLTSASRQLAKASTKVLKKRKLIMQPIAIWNRIDTDEPFATHLQKNNAPNPERKKLEMVSEDWRTNMAPESRICLHTGPPEWLAGVELIYFIGC